MNGTGAKKISAAATPNTEDFQSFFSNAFHYDKRGSLCGWNVSYAERNSSIENEKRM